MTQQHKKNSFTTALLVLAFSLSTSAFAAQETYKIDDSHSFANWSIRHVVAKASGTFTDIKGTIAIDRDNLTNSSVKAVINVLSVNSGLAKRDEHIKKPDYLDVEKYTEMTFVSSKVEAKNNMEGVITGAFTLHGVTKIISMPFKVLGFGQDPWGGSRIGIEATTTITASEYGFAWPLKANAPLGDDIAVTLLLEGINLP